MVLSVTDVEAQDDSTIELVKRESTGNGTPLDHAKQVKNGNHKDSIQTENAAKQEENGMEDSTGIENPGYEGPKDDE